LFVRLKGLFDYLLSVPLKSNFPVVTINEGSPDNFQLSRLLKIVGDSNPT
jgi:hypothetical protein